MFDPFSHLIQEVRRRGGFVNAHAHFDRAYSISPEEFRNGTSGVVYEHLFEKWKRVDAYKSSSTVENYEQHICEALRRQREFGVTTALSFIDCDPIAGKRAFNAAQKSRRYATEIGIDFKIACQTLKGVIESEARAIFEEIADQVDVIGGLPGADKSRESEHLDILLSTAKQHKKRVHVHVDQLNAAHEKETELLAKKTIEHGMENQVTAIHGISLGAHPKNYRKEVYRMCRDAGLSFVACPTAWIDSRRSENLTPTHNAITPLDELLENNIVVALGTDNIADIYKPFSDGNMITELRLLLEATHVYDFEALVRVATENGRKVLGI